MKEYNYIYFDTADRNTRKRNPDGYYAICTEDLQKLENVLVVSYPLDYASPLIRFLFGLHHTNHINKYVKLPLKSLWFPYYFKPHFAVERSLCFVVSGTYLSVDYLRYLKKKYPDAKFVKIHRDLVELWKKRYPWYTDEVVKEIYDLSFSYDTGDAEKYGYIHFDEFESRPDVPQAPDYPLCDVYFAGAAKNRLPRLIEVYDRLTAAGLKCSYYITGAASDQRAPRDGIYYAADQMSYREMLYRTVNARCILEMNQLGAVGYTSRFLEAVLYNKRLNTDNLSVRESKFYAPDRIQCFANVSDIDSEFVRSTAPVDYHYQGEFSPVHLIEKIGQALNDLEREENGRGK